MCSCIGYGADLYGIPTAGSDIRQDAAEGTIRIRGDHLSRGGGGLPGVAKRVLIALTH